MMRRRAREARAQRSLHILVLVGLLGLCAPEQLYGQTGAAPWDVALLGGRVLDPESGLDAIRNVGIRNGRVVAITSTRPAARDTVNVAGLVVAPGFIDLHSHGQDSVAYGYYARDGVTSALELEIGTYPVPPWYAEREGKARINYGVSVGHPGARRAFLQSDSSHSGVTVLEQDGPWARAPIATAALRELNARLEAGLRDGGVGIGMGIQYTPAASREEIMSVFETAGRHRVPLFVHMRFFGLLDPGGGVDALQELLAQAAATGASLHVLHITSMGLARTGFMLKMIEGARRHGLDITTEAYPYAASMTFITTAVFDPGWQQQLGISYHDLLWPATGERLTEESFARYRREGGLVVAFAIPDSSIDRALADPVVMVASDAYMGHPRYAGSHARVLRLYVRERKLLTLMDAVRKMTLLPARRLETMIPEMRLKGRVRVGVDADLTIFDPATVQDRATFEKPAQFSEGIIHVLVGGVFVVRNSELVRGVAPGRPIRRAAKKAH